MTNGQSTEFVLILDIRVLHEYPSIMFNAPVFGSVGGKFELYYIFKWVNFPQTIHDLRD